MNFKHFNPKQKGLTLVELLVGMLISLVVLGGVYQVFAGSSANYRMQEGLSRLQENGRFALHFLAKDIRQAGYRGCSSYGPLTNTLNNSDSWAYNFDIGVEGYNNVGSSVSYLGNLATLSGSDVIVIRTLVGDSVRITKNNNSAQVFAEATNIEENACSDNSNRVSGICEGDILLISDCKKSRSLQATNVTVSSGGAEINIVHSKDTTHVPGNNIASWGGASGTEDERFGPDSEIVKFSTIIYFIRNNSAGKPSLYRKIGTANAEELVEGVETMQVLYGIDIDNDRNINKYETANNVPEWDNVLSVRIGLLMRTPNEVRAVEHDHTADYNVLDEVFGPYDDNHMRRVFTATIGLRNRLR